MNDWIGSIGLGRCAVGALLVVAARAKLRANGPQLFRDAILGYDLVRPGVAESLATWVPRAELCVGLALVLGLVPPVDDAIGFLLIAMFTAVVCSSLVRGRANHCGCIGFSATQVQRVQWRLVIRNLGLMAILVADCAAPDSWSIGRFLAPESLARIQPPVLHVLVIAWVTALLATAVAAMWSHLRARTRGAPPSVHDAVAASR